MKTNKHFPIVACVAAVLMLSANRVSPHCDTLDGPVIQAAKAALQKGDVTPTLKWVRPDDEKEIREAFAHTMKVRSLGAEARGLADQHFFETLVRVHRVGEGEGFMGLKPAGSTEPEIERADKALELGNVDGLADELGRAVQAELRKRFADVAAKRKHADVSVAAGRAYVAAYVRYVHFIESVHTLALSQAESSHSRHDAGHER
jgi:hypothetical protein